MSEWQRYSVTELERAGVLLVQDGNHGNDRPRPDEFVSDGVAFIRAADMSTGRVDFSSASRIDDVARRRIRKGIGQPGDVLLSHKGTVGRVAMVPLDAPAFVCSPQTTFWRSLDDSELDRTFLRCFMSSPDFVAQLDSRKGETDMAPYVSLTEQRKLTVVLPPIEEQRAIAGVLGALDDKIESNRRIVATVDGLVRAEFAAAAADGEKVTFAALAERINRAATPGALDGATPYIGLEHMPRGSMILDDWGVAAGLESGKSFFERGDVLFGKLRPYFRKVGVAPVAGVCSTDVLVLRPRRGLGLLTAVAASEELIAYASAAASGTKMPRVSWEYIASFEVVVPNTERSARFEATVAPALDRALQAVDESRSLAAVRDTLLPELLSGRLRVREVEEMVGSV